MANPTIKAGALLNPQNLPPAATPDGTERIPALQSAAVGGSSGNTVDEPVALTSQQLADLPGNISDNHQTGTTYTFAASDNGKMVLLDNGSAITATVDTQANAGYAAGCIINFCAYGAGTVTIAAAGGVNVFSEGSKVASAGQYAVGSLLNIGADTWLLFGNLA